MSLQFSFTSDEIVQKEYVAKKDIEEIKIWIRNQSVPQICDQQVINFLISCDNDLEKTKKTIEVYYALREQYGELMFNDWRIQREDLQKAFKIQYTYVLQERTPENYTIIFTKLSNFLYTEFDLRSLVTLAFMSLDATVYQKPASGLISVLDLEGFGLMHLTRISVKILRPSFRYVQEALPIRLVGVHILNTPSFINKLMVILKPFMNMDLITKLHFHPSNLDLAEFSKKYIPKEYLPKDYQGLLPSLDTLNKSNEALLTKMETNFKIEEMQRRCI